MATKDQDYRGSSGMPAAEFEIGRLGVDLDRLRAQQTVLVDLLERSLEVIEFAYMNAPKQPKIIADIREALATTEKS